ncbi:unnamed protein product, partial [Mesorhabditis belari]|uniref:Transmembrane protein 120A n=1 Tax=Mesorhabditis belari TaxID=2138241 RepID=A0AAF3EAN5_9BILA
MTSADRFLFKRDYEKFKLRVTFVNLVLLVVNLVLPSRQLDLLCHFLMVWYYCTLTIRESILRLNGSQMHGWWVAHHYFATVISGVAITWSDDRFYQAFRLQFLLFALYISLCQQMQYKYQSGCLRRLHALGHGDTMDLTLEGFEGWMFRGLTFLLPFLLFAYLLELFHSYTLYQMWLSGETSWHVPVLGILFFIVGNGNLFMVAFTAIAKIREDPKRRKQSLRIKYQDISGIEKLQ